MSKKKFLLFLFFLIPLAHFPAFSNQHLPKIAVLSLIIISGFIFSIYTVVKENKISIYITQIDFAWIIFFIFVLISCINVNNLASAYQRLLLWYILFLLHFQFSIIIKYGLDKITLALLLGGTIAAGYGIYQSIDPVYYNTYPAYVTTFGNINFAAAYMSIALLLTTLPLKKKQNYIVIIKILCSIIILIYLIRSGSRGAWIAALTGIIIYCIIWSIAKEKISLKKLLVIIIIIIFALLPLMLSKTWRTQTINRWKELSNFKKGSVKVRLSLWKSTVSLIKENPFSGTGAGQFIHHFPRHRDISEYVISNGRVASHPHNDWLLIACEFGIIAILCFSFIIFLCIKELLKLLKTKTDRLKAECITLFSCIAGLLIISLVSSAFTNPSIAFILPLISGFVRNYETKKIYKFSLNFKKKTALIIVSSIITIGLITIVSKQLLSDIYFNSGQKHFKKGNITKAIKKFSNAVKYAPTGFNYVELARTLFANEQYNKSLKYFKHTIQIAPELENAYIDLGLCYLKKENKKQALKIWQKAYLLFPASKILNYNIVELLLRLKKNQEALSYIKRLQDLDKQINKDIKYLIKLGDVYKINGNKRKALSCYIKAKKKKESYPLPT